MNILEPVMITICLAVCITGLRKIIQASSLLRSLK